MIKTTGKEKNYELVEYVNDVNREHVEVLMELNINGIMDTAYSYGNQRLTNERFTEWTGYYTYDPRGSVTGVTDSEGMIWQSYRYNANGDMTFGKPQYNNVYSYNAESYNPKMESQYLRARYYNVPNGNFLTEDSYLGNIINPLTLNRYNYVNSSPLNYIDPSGHSSYGIGAPQNMTDPHAPTTTGPTGVETDFDLAGHGGALVGELLGGLLAGAIVMAAPVSVPVAMVIVGWGAATGMLAGGAIEKEHQIKLHQNDINEINKLIMQNQLTLYKISQGELADPTELKNLQRSLWDLREKLEISQCEIDKYQNDIKGYQRLAATSMVIVGGVSLTVQQLMAMSASQVADLVAITSGASNANTLTDAQQSRPNTLSNTINNHLTEGDFSGTLRDLQGNPVPNGQGGYFNHLEEMKNSYKALQKIKRGLEGSLKNLNLSNVYRSLLQEGLDKANSYISRIKELFEPFGGIDL